MVRLTDGIQKTLDRGIEPIERHEDADILQGDLLARGLKGVEDRALATRQVQARGPCSADGLKDLLHQLELIRGKGIVLHEVLSILVRPQSHAAIGEGELVLQNVAFGLKEPLQFPSLLPGVWPAGGTE